MTILKIAPINQERVATLDESPEIAGFFFHASVEPKVEDLVAKGLTASQSADVARISLAVLEAAPEMTTEAAEPPMRALVEELQQDRSLESCGRPFPGKRLVHRCLRAWRSSGEPKYFAV